MNLIKSIQGNIKDNLLLVFKKFNKQNLFQNLDKFKFNSSRKYLEDFAREAATSLPEGALVLDAGAGNSPYKLLFSNCCYESTDFCQVKKGYSDITYICDLTAVPVEDGKYDMVLLTQVLEHLPEPIKVLKEMHRILKTGGKLWLSAPFFYEEHEIPYDFYRYTQFGFNYLLEQAEFKVEKLEWLEGYYGTLSYQLKTASQALTRKPKDYGNGFFGIISAALMVVIKPLFILLSILFYYLDIKVKYVSSGQCKNYAIVAVKE